MDNIQRGGENTKRSGKFYRKNEAEVMEMLGLQPTKNSGSGWVEKEDGQSEHIICQLKSTDAKSISVKKQDIDTLLHNAEVSHKLPVFAIQFLGQNDIGDVYLMIRPEDAEDILKYLQLGIEEYNKRVASKTRFDLGITHNADVAQNNTATPKRQIISSGASREQFHADRDSKYNKIKKAT